MRRQRDYPPSSRTVPRALSSGGSDHVVIELLRRGVFNLLCVSMWCWWLVVLVVLVLVLVVVVLVVLVVVVVERDGGVCAGRGQSLTTCTTRLLAS